MNDTLKQLTETLAQINYAEKKLKGYLKEQSVLRTKKEEAYKKLEKENRDVDKIAGVSFQAFIATVFNNRQEKLEKEELEAIEAKRYYDSVVYEFESVQHEIAHLQVQVKAKSDVEVLYQNAINEKRQDVLSKNPKLLEHFETLETKKRLIESKVKELVEAINASNIVKQKTEYALNELKDAKNLGVWDMMGGGLLVTMAKRDHMATAQRIINDLNYSLKSFSKELSDVNMNMTGNIDIANYMGFADYFFDGFFMDMMVQDKINGALSKLSQLARNVGETRLKLESQLNTSEAEKTKLLEEMDEVIIRA